METIISKTYKCQLCGDHISDNKQEILDCEKRQIDLFINGLKRCPLCGGKATIDMQGIMFYVGCETNKCPCNITNCIPNINIDAIIDVWDTIINLSKKRNDKIEEGVK